MCDDKSFVRSAALRVYKGPSGAGKTEIPAEYRQYVPAGASGEVTLGFTLRYVDHHIKGD